MTLVALTGRDISFYSCSKQETGKVIIWPQSQTKKGSELRIKSKMEAMKKRKLTCVQIIKSKRFGKAEPKLLVRLKRTAREYSDFESLNQLT